MRLPLSSQSKLVLNFYLLVSAGMVKAFSTEMRIRHVSTQFSSLQVQPASRLLNQHSNARHCQAFPLHRKNMRHPMNEDSSKIVSTTSLQAAFVDIPTTLSAINAFYKTSPYVAALITCGVKASAADMVAQARHIHKKKQLPEEEDAPIQLRRNFAFILYGAIYQGLIQEFMINRLFPIWFGTGTGVSTVGTKVLFDMLVNAPFLNLPLAYICKAAIFGHSLREGLQRYIGDIMHNKLLLKFWMLWAPVQCLTFSVIPKQFRIAFIAMVSFFWMIALSSITSRQKVTNTEENEEEEEGCSLVDGITCNIDG